MRKLEPTFLSKFDNSFPSFRGADYTADRRDFFRREIPGGHSVCSYHEILNNVLCAVLFFDFEIPDFISFEYRFRLNGFKTQSSVSVSENFHALCYFILHEQIISKSIYGSSSLRHNPFPFQPRRYTIIREFCMIADMGPIDIRRFQRTV